MDAAPVVFHDDPTGALAPLAMAARLAWRSHRDGRRLLVLAADAAQASALDEALWSLAEDAFLPHDFSDSADAAAAAVLIAAPGMPEPAGYWRINLRADAVADASAVVLDIIPGDAAGKAAARQRWRSYQAQGRTPRKQAVPDLRA